MAKRRRSTTALLALGVAALMASGCGSGGNKLDVSTVLPKTYAATVATKTADVSFNLAVTGGSTGSKVTGQGNGAFDFAAKRGSIKLTVGIPSAGQVSINEVLANGVAYIQLPQQLQGAVGGKKWIGLSTSDFTGGASSSGVDPSQALSLLESHAQDVTKVGPENVDGVSTTHYRAQLDPRQVVANASPAVQRLLEREGTSLNGHLIPVDLWVDAQGRARRISETVTLTQAPGGQSTLPASLYPITTMLTLDFSNFGTPVNVSAPPASEVSNIPLSQLLSPSSGG
ncbi:MAG: hypothetical protein ACR2KC_06225 [Acidimicrobiales bacterium]